MQWNKYLLKDIADVRDGTHDSPKQVSEGFPLITSRHIKNGKINFLDTYNISEDDFNKINKRSKVDKYDIILSMIGTIGEICIVTTDKKFAIKNVALLKLHGNKLLSQFIYYYLKSPSARYNLIELTKGTTQEYVSLDDLRHFSLPIPPKSEQKTIVYILSSLDDKIDLLHRQNATLERMAETLFRQWFIEEAQEDWEDTSLDHFVQLIKETANPTSLDPSTKYIGLEHIDKKCISLERFDIAQTATSNKYIFKKGDILFGKLRPYFHKVCFTPFNGVCSTDIFVLRPKKIDMLPFCLFSFFQKDVVDFADYSSEGTRMPRVSWTALKQYKIKNPPIQKIEKFNFICQAYIEKIEKHQRQIQTLEKLRDTLLPKLLSGEIRVRVDE